MKVVEISDVDYKMLEWLGTDKWMAIPGDPPRSVEYVLHRIIEREFERANPSRYRSIQARED